MKVALKRNPQAGFNLIEAAIVLGIVGLVVGGIWAAAGAAYENMRQQNTSGDLLAFAQNIKNFYAGSGATTVETSAASLIQMGVVPRSFTVGTNVIRHPWGSDTGSNIELSSSAGTFTITFNVPSTGVTGAAWQAICNTLISRNANAATNTGMTWGLTASGATNSPPITGSPSCTTTSTPSFRFPISG